MDGAIETRDVTSNGEVPAQCLITSLGRSATFFSAKILANAGWKFDHDNRHQLCPCPGSDGSASHMYAFTVMRRCNYKSSPKLNHLFRRVTHQVRDPLAYINSRALDKPNFYCRCNIEKPPGLEGYSRANAGAILTMRKWVLQHSFIQSYADFRFKVEDANTNSSVFTELCHRCGLDTRPRTVGKDTRTGCPQPHEFQQLQLALGTKVNRDHVDEHATWTWPELFKLHRDYASSVILLARAYGYQIEPLEAMEGLRLHCGFASEYTDALSDPPWSCKLVRGS